jgi:hypothetical protein
MGSLLAEYMQDRGAAELNAKALTNRPGDAPEFIPSVEWLGLLYEASSQKNGAKSKINNFGVT